MWSFFKLIGKAMGLQRDSPNPPDSEAIFHMPRARRGSHSLAARSGDKLNRDIRVDRVQHRADHVAAEVPLRDDAVGLEFSVSGDRDPGPAFGRQVAGP